MNNKWSITDTLLYGADYNPDQWLDRPDILEEDLRLMKEAGFSAVSLGIFSWAVLEPKEGVFRFDWMDKMLDDLHGAGINVFLATPSGARPGWLAAGYPEVLRTGPDGNRNLFGFRHNHCYTSPVYREKTAIIDGELARRYASHPAVVLWHISNEYNGECHCELCQQAFRDWLKKRYGTLEALNKAWWNTFWSHTVTDWEHIHSPVPRGETMVHGLNLDWKRFVNYMTVDFMEHEIEAVRNTDPSIPVTTNLMSSSEDPEIEANVDAWKFRNKVDVVSWDSYPGWHMPGHRAYDPAVTDEPEDDYRRASEVAFFHDLFRCVNGGHFLLMESTPSCVNWRPLSKPKKPGMNILSGLQAVAHGSNSVMYFQWRKSLGGFEKFHGAVVGHDGTGDTRVFREAAELGKKLKDLSDIASTDYTARAALVYNWENRWALEDNRGPLNGERKAYQETVKKHYFALWDNGIAVDIISGEEELSDYDLVAAPMLYMVSAACGKRIRDFVEGGGCLLTTYQSGIADETDLCFEGAPGPLSDILGIRCEETDVLHPAESLLMSPLDITSTALPAAGGTVTDYCELIRTETARTVARFRGSLEEGSPALTVNDFGKGTAWYLAGRLDVNSLKTLYRHLAAKSGLDSFHNLIEFRTPGVNLQVRHGKSQSYLFVMNFGPEPGRIETKKSWTDALDTGVERTRWPLPAWGIKVLTSQAPPRHSSMG